MNPLGIPPARGVATHDAINTIASDIASAATTDIGAATGVFVNITGTTTITALGTAAAGVVRVLCFAATLVLTHNGTSLILPGAQNIITTTGDIVKMRSLGSGNWKCEDFLPYRRGSRRRIMNFTDANWAVSNTGTVAANTTSAGGRLLQVAASTSGRAYASHATAGGGANLLPGSTTTHDFSKSWRLRFSYVLNIGANPSSSCRACIHLSATSTTANDLSAKGLSIQWLGNGTVPTVRLQGYQSTTTNSSATVVAAADDTIHDGELVFVAGAGAFLFIDGQHMASLTTGIPTGSGTVNSVRTALVAEGVAGDASGITLRTGAFAEIEIAS